MNRKNIYAFTETTAPSYPGFISLNQEESGAYSIAVRNRGHGGSSIAVIEMSGDELEAMARNILAHLGVGTPATDSGWADLGQAFETKESGQ